MWPVGHCKSAAEAQRWMAGEEEENMQQRIPRVNMLTSVLVLTHHPLYSQKLLTLVELPLRILAFPGHCAPQHLARLPECEHPIDCTATFK